MPRKTGEDQLLLLTAPMLRQRQKRIQFRSTWVDRYALCALVYAQGQQPGECWLCEADERAEVRRRTEVTSRHRWLSVLRRECVLQSSDGSATPRCDATYSFQARRQTRRRATANCDSPHQRGVGGDTEPTILQIMLPSAASPPKRKSAVSMRSSKAPEHFFVAGDQLHIWNESMWATLQEDESVRRPAQVLHAFFMEENMFRYDFFYRPRMKLVQQVPHRLTVHTTSACC